MTNNKIWKTGVYYYKNKLYLHYSSLYHNKLIVRICALWNLPKMSLTFINRSECSFLGTNNTIDHSLQADIELWQTYLLFIALGVFSALLATFFNFIRSKIYKEKVRFLTF